MKNTSYLFAAAIGALLVSTSANAAGFYIQEQSVSAGGSAYAGAASNTNDASTIFFNPAGMTKLSGAQANLGVQLLVPEGKMKDTGSTAPSFLGGGAIGGSDGGNPYTATPVPSFYAATPVTSVDGLWIGIGVTAPFGLTNKYKSDFFGRFDSLKTELITTDIQPSVAYQVNDKVSIGGGLNIQRASAELTSAANSGGTEGISSLSGDDWSVGYTLGAQVELTPATTLGLNYRSSVHHDLNGRVVVTGTPSATSFTAIDGGASLVTPDIASVGLSHDLNDKWTVMGQVNWMGWSNFGKISAISDAGTPVTNGTVEQNYQNVWSYALGAEYTHSPEWTFRGGIQYDNTPTTDEYRTSRTPDGDRTWFATGATYTINPAMSLDFNATYIHIADETVNVSRNGGTTTVKADTEGRVGIVGAAFNYKF